MDEKEAEARPLMGIIFLVIVKIFKITKLNIQASLRKLTLWSYSEKDI